MTTTLASVPLPCSAAQLENAILKVAHNGHWHDAEVKVHGDKLVITCEDTYRPMALRSAGVIAPDSTCLSR